MGAVMDMDMAWIIRIAYGVMILAVVLSFLFSKKQQRQVRLTCNRFAFAFVKISNYVCADPKGTRLAVENKGTGKAQVLPMEDQPEKIRIAMERALSDKVVALYREMSQAQEELDRQCSRSKRLKRQFSEPIEQMFGVARAFLLGCEHPEILAGETERQGFDEFLSRQLHYRKELLKRISGDAGPEFAKLNHKYDMKAEEG